ncbi:hypothetical protein, partial [Microbispora bryophytorum]
FVTVYNGVIPTEGGTSGGKYESKLYDSKWDAYKAKKQLASDKTTALSKLDVVEVNKLSRFGKDTAVSVADFQAYNKGKNLTGNGPWAWFTSASAPVSIDKSEYKSWTKDSYVSQDGTTLFWRVHKPGTQHDYLYFKRTFSAKLLKGYQVVGAKLSIGLKDVGTLGSNVGG